MERVLFTVEKSRGNEHVLALFDTSIDDHTAWKFFLSIVSVVPHLYIFLLSRNIVAKSLAVNSSIAFHIYDKNIFLLALEM